jgi:hypothetical protein
VGSGPTSEHDQTRPKPRWFRARRGPPTVLGNPQEGLEVVVGPVGDGAAGSGHWPGLGCGGGIFWRLGVCISQNEC